MVEHGAFGMHNIHLDIYQLLHRQYTTKPLVLISTAVAGATEILTCQK